MADAEGVAKRVAPLRNLSKKRLVKFNEENERKGVCYIARVPPYLKPQKLRQLLSGFGTDVLRIYLAPEDKTVRAKRIRSGGNRKQMFTEGWVEFADKRVAKRLATTLNNSAIGGNKRGFYASDLWNIKYLPKFKWNDLTERLAHEAKVREQKLRLELAQAKRENTFYMQQVSRSKAIDAMASRKRGRGAGGGGKAEAEAGAREAAQRADAGGDDDAAGRRADGASSSASAMRVRRMFGQKPVLTAPTAESAPALDKAVLGKVLRPSAGAGPTERDAEPRGGPQPSAPKRKPDASEDIPIGYLKKQRFLEKRMR